MLLLALWFWGHGPHFVESLHFARVWVCLDALASLALASSCNPKVGMFLIFKGHQRQMPSDKWGWVLHFARIEFS